jgi:hypothetical protein
MMAKKTLKFDVRVNPLKNKGFHNKTLIIINLIIIVQEIQGIAI